MTPALQAMVEAMLAEMRSQNVLDETDYAIPDHAAAFHVSGCIRLDAVARAGLAAIREPGPDVMRSGCIGRDEPELNWPAAIDEILRETP